MDTYNIYKDINARTQGEIYIGVVGPVRSGKSTFIKHFAEKLILPFMSDGAGKERAKDCLLYTSDAADEEDSGDL